MELKIGGIGFLGKRKPHVSEAAPSEEGYGKQGIVPSFSLVVLTETARGDFQS